MLGHLTTNNLYKVYLEDPTTNLMTIFQQAITANIFKSAANLFVWHCRFAHLNETFIKILATIPSAMVISHSNNKLLFYNVYVEAKITRHPYWQPQMLSKIPGFRIHPDFDGGKNTHATFCRYCYFIFFVCEATGYILVRYFKKSSEVFVAFWALVTLLQRQYGIRVCTFHTDSREFNSEAAADYFFEIGII